MAKANDVSIDTAEVKSALTIFDNLKEELDIIKESSDISGALLIPKDFYNGCKINDTSIKAINNYNIGSEYNDMFKNYINTNG